MTLIDITYTGSPKCAREYSTLGCPYMRKAGIFRDYTFALLQSLFMSQQLSKGSMHQIDHLHAWFVEFYGSS